MQSYYFDLYLQCQKNKNDMKTRKQELIEDICFVATAITLEEKVKETIFISEEKFERNVTKLAERMKVLVDMLNKLEK